MVALGTALALSACGGSSGASGESEATESKAEGARLSKPKVQVPKGAPPKALVVEDLNEGSGTEAKSGDEVNVHYVGVQYKNGKQIDASWNRGEPLSFELGGGTVIAGWEQGVGGMKEGGRRKLIIPSKLAYGSGALVFVIDLLAVDASSRSGQSDSGTTAATERDRKPKVEVPSAAPPKELVIEDLKSGSGTAVKPGDEITVDYVGVNYKTGQEFEATWDRGEPTTFQLGVGEVIQGWERGMKGMKVGGRRELIIPSKLAFERGAVIYVVDLLEVK